MRRIFVLVALLSLALAQAASAVIAVRQVKGQQSGASGTQTTVVVSGLTTPINGDLMILVGMSSGGTSYSTPSGWTLVTPQAVSGSSQLAIFARIASGEGTSYTLTDASGDYLSCVFLEFTGAAPTVASALSQFSTLGWTGGSSTNVITTSTLTPAMSSELPLTLQASNGGGGVTSTTAGWTQQYSSQLSTQSGNGFHPNYDSIFAAIGPVTTLTGTFNVTTWNFTALNGPSIRYWIGLITPGSGAAADARSEHQSFPVNGSTWGFRRR